MSLQKLKEEFNIDQLSSLTYETIVSILYTSNYILELLRTELVPFDISYQQYNALKIIDRAPDKTLNCSTLKELMIEKNSDITRLSIRLEEKGLIARKKDNLNKRNVNLVLKSQGLKLVEQINNTITVKMNDLFLLNTQETKQLNHLLNELILRHKQLSHPV